MAGRARGGGGSQSVTGRAGDRRAVRPILVCVVVLAVAGYQTAPCAAQCANSDRPTMMRVRRHHLDEMSAIATDILDMDVVIPNSYTDAQLLMLMDAMHELAPKAVADFEAVIGREYTRALDTWIWMCRAQQTLGKRRKRDNDTEDLA